MTFQVIYKTALRFYAAFQIYARFKQKNFKGKLKMILQNPVVQYKQENLLAQYFNRNDGLTKTKRAVTTVADKISILSRFVIYKS